MISFSVSLMKTDDGKWRWTVTTGKTVITKVADTKKLAREAADAVTALIEEPEDCRICGSFGPSACQIHRPGPALRLVT